MSHPWRCWVPVLKVQDARESTKFYCRVLGFTQEWEHQFDDDFPVYCSVSRDGLSLHLSEHGDEPTNITLIISVEDVDAAYAELCDRGLQPQGPPEDRPYGVRDFAVSDPDGHRLVFATSLADFDEAPGRKLS